MPSDYERIGKAITWLEANAGRNPSLSELSRVLGLSDFHTHRLFKRWAGITPHQFLQVLNVHHARQLLEESRSILDVTYELGLSGPGRLHDQMVNVLALSPGEYKQGGAGIVVEYGIVESPFGPCLLGRTSRGICHLSFTQPRDEAACNALLSERFPRAAKRRNEPGIRALAEGLFDARHALTGRTLHLAGTNFQIQVWEALLTIPPGRLLSYGDIAARIGQPDSFRAVGQAVGANPISWLIPCHRVIQASGLVGNYRWGSTRKKAILAYESRALE